nr:MAG TPA: hypothetical protein [Caudoviricetes sp.]
MEQKYEGPLSLQNDENAIAIRLYIITIQSYIEKRLLSQSPRRRELCDYRK